MGPRRETTQLRLSQNQSVPITAGQQDDHRTKCSQLRGYFNKHHERDSVGANKTMLAPNKLTKKVKL